MTSMTCIGARHTDCPGVTYEDAHVVPCSCPCHDEPNDSGVESTQAVD